MKKFLCWFLISPIVLLSCQTSSTDSPTSAWTSLLDAELSEWDTYLSYRHKEGYDGSQPLDETGNPIPPIGLNKDSTGVFRVLIREEEPILRISGEIYGCLASKKEFENYHLRMKMKWGEKKWPPREHKLKDSGILYHSIGPHGAEHWRSWMLSQEFQVMEGHMGDFWNQATSAIDIRAFPPEYIMSPVADLTQDFLPMGEEENIKGYCMRRGNYERPSGEWNSLELICFEGQSLHIVNGEIAMILRNSRYVEDGESIPLTKGKIQIQSEAAELFYKEIEIHPLDSLPLPFVPYFNP